MLKQKITVLPSHAYICSDDCSLVSSAAVTLLLGDSKSHSKRIRCHGDLTMGSDGVPVKVHEFIGHLSGSILAPFINVGISEARLYRQCSLLFFLRIQCCYQILLIFTKGSNKFMHALSVQGLTFCWGFSCHYGAQDHTSVINRFTLPKIASHFHSIFRRMYCVFPPFINVSYAAI